MLFKTHIVISIFFILLFILSVEHKIAFVLTALLATLIPDVDSRFSIIGRKKVFRILQFFVKHRGIFHSFSFLSVITLFFVLFLPVLAFPFFLGYGLHLLIDSFSVKGIMPFYPYRKTLSGRIRDGGKAEVLIFVLFIFLDIVIFFVKIF